MCDPGVGEMGGVDCGDVGLVTGGGEVRVWFGFTGWE